MNPASLVDGQRRFFQSGGTLPAGYRQDQLRRLATAIEARETALLEALRADLGKPAQEAYTAEIGLVLSEIRHARRSLASWMAPQRRRLPLLAWPGRAEIRPEPFGVALIISPWNYPFQLLFSPLVGAVPVAAVRTVSSGPDWDGTPTTTPTSLRS